MGAPPSLERWLRWTLLALILFALAIRVPLLVHAKTLTDEPEHLHAAWAVAQGQLIYRDFWQSHTPLFYYLLAPVFMLMGEDLRVISVSRGLMLLCIVLILLQLYRIAHKCFDALTGLLAVLLLSYLWLWWRPTYESRPDIPETLLVLVSLWRFMRAWERRSRADFLVAGALLGVGFWLVIKTLFPLAGLTAVFGLSAVLRRSRAALREAATGLLLFLGAFAVPLGVGGSLLWAAGAWPAFLRWAVVGQFLWPERFSALPMMYPEVHFVFFGLALVGVGLTVGRLAQARVIDEVRLSPLLAGVVTAIIYLFMMPVPYPQSALPFLPLAAMYAAAVVRSILARALPSTAADPSAPGGAEAPPARSPVRLAWAVLAALLLVGVCVPPLRALLREMPPLSDQEAGRRRAARYVLALTSPDDSVFDRYGQYIFRPHATYYYRLSKMILIWLRSGAIAETDIMNDLRRSHCKVVWLSPIYLTTLPPNLFRFLLSHYIHTYTGSRGEVSSILVAGKVLRPMDLLDNQATVSLIASTEYAVRSQGADPRIYIDGRLYQSPLFLAQGDHQIQVEGAFQEIAIFYSRVLSVRPIRTSDPDQ